MIEELHINKIGGIDEAHLFLSRGLTAITGESGSGKSSVIRSLELISGKRSSAAMIRSENDSGSVEAVFYNEKDSTPDTPPYEDGRLFVKREIIRNGRGKISIQNRQAPLSVLSDLSQTLITIQSQFAQLELLDPDKQLDMVDRCGGDELISLKEDLRNQVRKTIENEKKLQELKRRQRSITDRFHSAEEIVCRWRKLDVSIDSEKQWEDDYRNLSVELERLNEIRKIRFRMKNDEPGSLKEELDDLMDRLLSKLSVDRRESASPHIDTLLDSYNAILAVVDSEVDKERRENLEEAVEELESRMGTLRKLKRSAGVSSLQDLIQYCGEADRELAWLAESNDIKNAMEKEVDLNRKTASKMAMDLRGKRRSASAWLEEKVNRCLAQMAMEDSFFSVGLIEGNKLRPNGAESVEFRLSWNGGDPGPVAKMASGGELSRILLAIRLSMPEESRPPTVVFDEVEAGLGGRAAVLAGLKLKELSEKCQVILVTHEASIAALADRHLMVRRTGNISEIKELRDDQRISEVARMLSGDLNMEEAKSHAAKLLKI